MINVLLASFYKWIILVLLLFMTGYVWYCNSLAGDLHKILEVKAEFSHWIKRRIKQCKFEENFDYTLVVKKDEQVSGAKYLNEYIISVDMTKHLGMMERNEKGHEIRKYYIEQEELARQLKVVQCL